MKDTRTPIERMIDKATGAGARRNWITMRCPTCDKTARSLIDKSDPHGTATVIFKCPDCMKVSPSDDLRYLDKDGKEITA